MSGLCRDARALLIVAAAYLACTALCFGVAQEIDVDTGRDFIAPDLMLQGRVLYRDVAYQYGPAAPWLHYGLFRLFGPSATILLIAGAAAGFVIAVLALLIARQILPVAVAIIAALFVTVNSVYGPTAMSYAVPYTLSAVYGLLFSLLGLYAVLRNLDQPYTPLDLVAGGAFAWACASKHEFALIAILTMLASFLFRFWKLRRRALGGVLAVLVSYLAVTGAFLFALLRKVSAAELWSVAYPKEHLAAYRLFYQVVQYWGPFAWIGIKQSVYGFLLNFGFILSAACLLALLAGCLSGERPGRRSTWMLVAFGLPLVYSHRYLWYFPLLLHAAVLSFLVFDRARPSRLRAAFLTLSASFFLFRVLPAPKFDGSPYTLLFYIPSLIVYLYLCFCVAVPALSRWFPESRLSAAMIALFVSCFTIYPLLKWTYPWARQAERIRAERGTLRTVHAQAEKGKAILGAIGRYSVPGDRILLIPSGAIFYFLSARQPASRYLEYAYGNVMDGQEEDEEIRALDQNPPKLIVVDDVHFTFYFSGPVNQFGKAYNARLDDWIHRNYKEASSFLYADRLVHVLIPAGAGLRSGG